MSAKTLADRFRTDQGISLGWRADGFIFFGGSIDHTVNAVDDFGADWIALPDGGTAELVSDVEAWRAAGGIHISLVSMGLGMESAERHIEYLNLGRTRASLVVTTEFR